MIRASRIRVTQLLLCSVVLLTASGAGAAATDARATVQATTDQLLAVIKEGKTYADADPERFYKEVQRVLDPAIDFDTFARGVMAAYGKKATPAQRDQFEATFKTGLIRTYAKALLSFTNEKISVLPADRPQTQPDKDSVKTEIVSKEGKVYPILYSMRLDKDGKWRVYNIIINGINIGLTYRNQFASSMKAPENHGNIEAVISGWGETIAHVDPAAEGAKEAEGASTAGEAD
jgi:phospholipid transport system substrate-binding protein